MYVSGKINTFRKKITKLLTRQIGRSPKHHQIKWDGKNEAITNILVCRPNHRLGNLLLTTPLIQELVTLFPESKVDLFVKGNLSPTIFEMYPNVGKIIQLPRKPFESLSNYFSVWLRLRKSHYDLVINVEKNSSSGKLATMFANSRCKFFGYDQESLQMVYPDYMHMAKHSVYNLRNFLSPIGLAIKQNEIPALNLQLTSKELTEGEKKLKALVGNSKTTICLFTFATGEKCYSKKWWNEFYTRLRTEFPAFNFIEVLPVENVSQLSFCIPSYYSRDIRDLGSFIANTQLFIGADSGIMHLASSVNVPTVGLFSVTDSKKYGPYGPRSIALETGINNTDFFVDAIKEILLINNQPAEKRAVAQV